MTVTDFRLLCTCIAGGAALGGLLVVIAIVLSTALRR